MEAWERWWSMAQGSLKAAQLLAQQGEVRSSASRAYHAAYQAVTAVLLYYGMTPPADREAWSHTDTPGLIWKLAGTTTRQDARRDVASRLYASYELRLKADYNKDDAEVSALDLKTSIKTASFVVKWAEDILPQR